MQNRIYTPASEWVEDDDFQKIHDENEKDEALEYAEREKNKHKVAHKVIEYEPTVMPHSGRKDHERG